MSSVIEVHDLQAPELRMFAQLTEVQLRNRLEPELGVFIAESPKVIRLALKSGYEPIAFLMERKFIDGQASDIIDSCRAVPVYTGERELLTGLTGYRLTRGVLCAMRRPALPHPLEMLQGVKRAAVLEDIADAVNVGAIFRSAAALNVDAVLVTPSCCDPLCRRAVRVSMGTVFQIPWTRWDGGSEGLRQMGFKTAALALSADAISIENEALSKEKRLALFFGSEGYGLKESTIAACDYQVIIPMSHQVDSLNVAAASAVAFWQLRVRQED